MDVVKSLEGAIGDFFYYTSTLELVICGSLVLGV